MSASVSQAAGPLRTKGRHSCGFPHPGLCHHLLSIPLPITVLLDALDLFPICSTHSSVKHRSRDSSITHAEPRLPDALGPAKILGPLLICPNQRTHKIIESRTKVHFKVMVALIKLN